MLESRATHDYRDKGGRVTPQDVHMDVNGRVESGSAKPALGVQRPSSYRGSSCRDALMSQAHGAQERPYPFSNNYTGEQ